MRAELWTIIIDLTVALKDRDRTLVLHTPEVGTRLEVLELDVLSQDSPQRIPTEFSGN